MPFRLTVFAMRIRKATLRNYRRHRELTVEFDAHRTLIGGPNEVGKSTLVEAIHRALFLRSKGNTETHRDIQSAIHAGQPEVELSFEVGGDVFQLRKRFGTNGGTTLFCPGLTPLTGDAAEEALARVLRVEPATAGKAVLAQWGHLWVWQGKAAENPSDHATTQRDALLQRLQGSGAGGALQSALDGRVAGEFASRRAAMFTQAGKPKAGSELELAEAGLAEAEMAAEKARMDWGRLQSAAKEVEDANVELPRIEVCIKALQGELEAVEERSRKLHQLQLTAKDEAYEVNEAAKSAGLLQEAEKSLREIIAAAAALERELAPRQSRLAELEGALTLALSSAAKSQKEYQFATDGLRNGRRRYDLAVAWRRDFEATEKLGTLNARKDRVITLRRTMQDFLNTLARLPAVDDSILADLRKMEARCEATAAALNAMAASLEIVSAGLPVLAAGEFVAGGAKLVITEETELRIGDAATLRITPGGGTSLVETRQAVSEARAQLQGGLDRLGVTSVLEADQFMRDRSNASAQIEKIKATLDGLGAAMLEQELSAAGQECAATQAQVASLADVVGDVPEPVDGNAAKKLEREFQSKLKSSEANEYSARKTLDELSEAATTAEGRVKQERADLARDLEQLERLRWDVRKLVAEHGDEERRADAQREANKLLRLAKESLDVTNAAIADLQPELLDGDKQRLNRAIEQKEVERRQMDQRLSGARAHLRLDGVDDPQAALESSEARAIAARKNRNRVHRQASAVALLHNLFEDEQRSLAERFTRPLAERISGYLQSLYGPGTSVRVILEDNRFTGLALTRPSEEGITFAFDALSGGTREQTAAAVRLAMAEVLAADHGGCLPVVFDDAFAYSDPERVSRLQRMLDLAAKRGLQVIVLSCNPADYAALGATSVILRPGPAVTRDPVAIGTPRPDVPAEGDQPREDEFLAELTAFGGSAGNTVLRQKLGWEESAYEAVKAALLGSGRIKAGRGRGGSVSLNAAEAGAG